MPSCVTAFFEAQGAALQQLQAAKTRMAVARDDNVVVDGDPERFGDLDDLFGHLNVGPRRCRVARRVVVERPTQFNMMLILKCFFDALTELVPVIGIGFCDRP